MPWKVPQKICRSLTTLNYRARHLCIQLTHIIQVVWETRSVILIKGLQWLIMYVWICINMINDEYNSILLIILNTHCWSLVHMTYKYWIIHKILSKANTQIERIWKSSIQHQNVHCITFACMPHHYGFDFLCPIVVVVAYTLVLHKCTHLCGIV